jgi:hypothetical protein
MRSLHLSIAALVLLMFVSFGASTWLTIYSVQQSQSRWCAIFNLSAQIPVAKPGPDATEQQKRAYRFYLLFLDLKHDYGCDS